LKNILFFLYWFLFLSFLVYNLIANKINFKKVLSDHIPCPYS
jgi:hypothetical protein